MFHYVGRTKNLNETAPLRKLPHWAGGKNRVRRNPTMTNQGQFIGEAITPVLTESLDAGRMSFGEPALPGEFRWSGGSFVIAGVVRRWKEHGPCRNGGRESYLRKHWFEVVASDGRTIKLYFERQPARGKKPGARDRWQLFSISGGSLPG